MIRTQIVPCKLNKEICDSLNLASGRIYSGIVSRHWRLLKQKSLWLKEKSLTRLSDMRVQKRDYPMHAHAIDAAQQGFFKACVTTRALRKAGFPEANFPWRSKKFRTTTWKNTAIKFGNGIIRLSNGQGNTRIEIALPKQTLDLQSVLEVRLVFDKKSRKYTWHIVIETGKQAKQPLGNNVVSVDPGEIHPAVVGDEQSATIITGRERRAKQRGHAKALKFFSKALARKKKGSKRYKRLVRAKSRCKAKNRKVMRDIEHKISHAIVAEAVARDAATIVYGDIRDIADGIDKGKKHNQHMAQWDHGKVRGYVEYKAAAEGIAVVLQNEAYTSTTCPSCGNKHKPRGRKYKCPSCGFSGHRDVIGQINILSKFKFGEPGKIPSPTNVTYRIPYHVRVMRKWADTPQEVIPVAQPKQLLLFA
jgi:putative transposase